jgi:hypothetical protein
VYGYPVAGVSSAGCRRSCASTTLGAMKISLTREAPSATRIAAAALAALGAASAIPIPLAQLDFAGLIDVFNIDHGDAPHALLVIAAVGGTLTFAVLALALAGSFLAATGTRSARTLLIVAALAGLVTAMPLWIPAGVLIGAAALLLGPDHDRYSGGQTNRNLLPAGGVDTRSLRQGET